MPCSWRGLGSGQPVVQREPAGSAEQARHVGEITYDQAIAQVRCWYCWEPRLAFNRTVILRYRKFSTIIKSPWWLSRRSNSIHRPSGETDSEPHKCPGPSSGADHVIERLATFRHSMDAFSLRGSFT
jgi:hypothetical protein